MECDVKPIKSGMALEVSCDSFRLSGYTSDVHIYCEVFPGQILVVRDYRIFDNKTTMREHTVSGDFYILWDVVANYGAK